MDTLNYCVLVVILKLQLLICVRMGINMSIRYKENILELLKDKGYTTTKLRKEKIFGEKTIQDFRSNAEIPYKTLDKLCCILNCNVGDIIEYIEEQK